MTKIVTAVVTWPFMVRFEPCGAVRLDSRHRQNVQEKGTSHIGQCLLDDWKLQPKPAGRSMRWLSDNAGAV